jgi:hypothetical protein
MRRINRMGVASGIFGRESGACCAAEKRRLGRVMDMLSVILAAWTATLAAGGMAKETPRAAQPNGPVAILVATKAYARCKPLAHSVQSTAQLAQALVINGYRVTLVTDSVSQDEARKVFDSTAPENIVTADTAEATQEHLEKWLSTHFGDQKSRACFGFCGFSGHGETRTDGIAKTAYYLTRDDASGNGGVNLGALKQKIGKSRLPVVLFVDTCRTSTSEVPAGAGGKSPRPLNTKEAAGLSHTDLINAIRTSPLAEIDLESVEPVTTLWATQEGDEAPDDVDFFSLLAEGLERGESDRLVFRAREYRGANRQVNGRDASVLEGDKDLSLYTWFAYAAISSELQHEFKYRCKLEEGYVSMTMICASLDAKKVLEPPEINLVHHLRFPFVGGLVVNRDERGLTYSRGMQANQGGVGTAFFAEPIEWQGKSLGVELTPTQPNARPNEMFRCLIQPGNNHNGAFLSPEWNVGRDFPYNQTSRLLVPLQGSPEQTFASLALSADPSNPGAWPSGASANISRILVIDNKSGQVLQQPVAVKEVDLVSRWWDEDNILQHPLAQVKGSREKDVGNQRKLVISIEGAPPDTMAGKGGIVYAAPFLDSKRYQLEVVVRSLQADGNPRKACEAKLALLSENRELVSAILKKPGKHLLPIKEGGFPDYLSIVGVNSSRIEISRVALVPITTR